MSTLLIHWNTIQFQFNSPTAETNFLREDFDIIHKPSCVTIWIEELMNTDNEFELNEIYSKILTTLSIQAKIIKLDYLQKISINNIEVWCIDDGNSICLMTKSEY